MKKLFLLSISFLSAIVSLGQTAYKDSMARYFDTYISKHEVVKGADKKAIHFFSADTAFRVRARFERRENGEWFQMKTSSGSLQIYRVYGVITFKLHDTTLKLNVYQSQLLMETKAYKNHLFLPFTDFTTGNETYEGGRYIDLEIGDIANNEVVIDFNKAYNPYCAYVNGRYNCPLPPRENHLAIAVTAGEKKFREH